MSDPITQVREFKVTVPAGTTAINPQITQCQMGAGFLVRWIELRIPPGPAGAVGFYLASSLTQIVPYRVGATPEWMIGDNDSLRYDLDIDIDSGDWQTVIYNTGSYSHTVAVRFGIWLPPLPPPSPNVTPYLASVLTSG